MSSIVSASGRSSILGRNILLSHNPSSVKLTFFLRHVWRSPSLFSQVTRRRRSWREPARIEFRASGGLRYSLCLHHAARHIIVRAPGRPGRMARQQILQNVPLWISVLVRHLQESWWLRTNGIETGELNKLAALFWSGYHWVMVDPPGPWMFASNWSVVEAKLWSCLLVVS